VISFTDIYLSATVLLAARLNPSAILDEIPVADLDASWERALRILQDFQNDDTSAKNCVTVLQVLYKKLSMTPQNQPLESVLDGIVSPEMQPLHSHHVTGRAVLHGVSELPMSDAEQYEWFNSLTEPDFADMSWLSAVPGALFSNPE
jgi:hypothetical protein